MIFKYTSKTPCGAVLLSMGLIVAGVLTPAAAHVPKMIAEEVTAGKRLGPPAVPEIVLSSNSSIYIGECSPGDPFLISLYGPSGMGTIGVEAPAENKGIYALAPAGASVTVGDATEPDFFAAESTDEFEGHRMEFTHDGEPSPGGVPIEIHCTSDTPVVVIFNDDVDLVIEAAVTELEGGDDIELLGGVESKIPLSGSTRPKKGQGSSPVSFKSATGKKISAAHRGGNNNGLAVVDGVFATSSGDEVRRSIVRNVGARPAGSMAPPRPVAVDCCDINEAGDIDVRFPGLAKKDDYFRVDARFGIALDSESDPVEVVDVRAMLTQNGHITVHGGWIRKALQEMGLEDVDEGWSVDLIDVVVSDPSQAYRVVGVKGNVINNGVPPGLAKRAMLSKGPTAEEAGISEEMQTGKKPSADERRRRLGGESVRRQLYGGHKKILLHGYCSITGNPFPLSHFSNAIAFYSGVAKNNWSHDEFARRVDTFADNNGLHGCGLIAHSQGGAASLHLYSYYWSCLDYSENGSRMIQSVGTPYQGTPLAGNLAVLGQVFGVGCGYNNDLTTSGAASWLNGIPYWARGQVNYYTTTFVDRWWSYDYCHVATDLLLSDPEDGTTEVYRGQLPGANNRGTKAGWCHTVGMYHNPQCSDQSRNSEMNAYARY